MKAVKPSKLVATQKGAKKEAVSLSDFKTSGQCKLIQHFLCNGGTVMKPRLGTHSLVIKSEMKVSVTVV